jgi:hypothetical protein
MTGVRLTSGDITRLNLAQRALLSPLDDGLRSRGGCVRTAPCGAREG